MIDQPLFSVVIPTCGRAELLQAALRSVLAQTVTDFEVVVVDDGGRGVVVRPTDPRVHVLTRERRGGAAAARNEGIRASRGRYVTFLDDDDEFTPDRLKTALEGLRHAPIALCWKAGLGDGLMEWDRVLHGDVSGALLEAPVPQLGSAALRRDLVLPLDETFTVSEDVEWWLRMSRVGPVYTCPRVGYLIRDHEGGRQRDRVAARLAARLRLLELHQDYFAEHRRAAAYHWLRAGGLAESRRQYGLALRCYVAALRARPDFRPLGHAARAASLALAHLTRSHR